MKPKLPTINNHLNKSTISSITLNSTKVSSTSNSFKTAITTNKLSTCRIPHTALQDSPHYKTKFKLQRVTALGSFNTLHYRTLAETKWSPKPMPSSHLWIPTTCTSKNHQIRIRCNILAWTLLSSHLSTIRDKIMSLSVTSAALTSLTNTPTLVWMMKTTISSPTVPSRVYGLKPPIHHTFLMTRTAQSISTKLLTVLTTASMVTSTVSARAIALVVQSSLPSRIGHPCLASSTRAAPESWIKTKCIIKFRIASSQPLSTRTSTINSNNSNKQIVESSGSDKAHVEAALEDPTPIIFKALNLKNDWL